MHVLKEVQQSDLPGFFDDRSHGQDLSSGGWDFSLLTANSDAHGNTGG